MHSKESNVDLKRFSIILLVFAGVLLLLSLHASRQARERRKSQGDRTADKEAAPAASAPVTKPAIAAARRATTRPAAAPIAATQPAATRPTVAAAPTTQPTTQPSPPQWLATGDAPAKIAIGSRDESTGYVFEVELTNERAAIQTVRLSKYFATVDDKRLARKHKGNYEAYEEARSKNPDKYKGQYSLLSPVEHKQTKHLSLATRDISVRPASGEGSGNIEFTPYWESPRKQRTDEGEKVSFERTYCRGGKTAAEAWEKFRVLRVVKTYEIEKSRPREEKKPPPLGYTIRVSFHLENLSDEPVTVELDHAGPTGVPREAYRGDQRAGAYGRLIAKSQKVKVDLEAIKEFSDRKALGESHDDEEPALWVGYVNQYFGAMLYLVGKDKEKLQAAEYEAEFYIEPIGEGDDKTLLTGVRIPKIVLAAKGKAEAEKDIEFELFVGPKRRDMFKNEDDEYFRQRYATLDYFSTVDLGGCFCAWGPLTEAMMWLLQKLSKVGNYGVGIFLLVLVVRILLHPLTKKSQVSMVKMQKLAPQMQKLKEKYADDKETLNKEMMQMYKQQGAVPILGCLPMFLQMPIWIALYTALRASVELRHAAFLPWWIKDLAAPDRLLTWGGDIWLVTWATDNSLNLLPILVAVSMFLQSKFNPQMSGAAATRDQARQQSLMKWMMPAMMLFIFYGMPSGLNLYIMASTFASVGEQWVIRKHIQAREAAEAAITTTVTIPGKAARSKRPKKPRGPFWVKRG